MKLLTVAVLALVGCGPSLGPPAIAHLASGQQAAIAISGDHSGGASTTDQSGCAQPKLISLNQEEIHLAGFGAISFQINYRGPGAYSTQEVLLSGVYNVGGETYGYSPDRGTLTVSKGGGQMELEADSRLTIPSTDLIGSQPERQAGKAHISAVWLCT